MIDFRRMKNVFFSRRPLLGRTFRSRFSKPSLISLRKKSAGDSFGFRQRSFYMRRVSFRRSNTRLSTRSHTRLLTGAFYKSVGARWTSRIVEAIERLYPDRLVEQLERLAHHAFRGELWEKAVDYLHQAGKKAASRSATREAIACFEQAFDALKRLPENRQTIEKTISIRVDLGPVLVVVGGYAATEVEENYTRARELCEQLRETPQLFPVLWGLARMTTLGVSCGGARIGRATTETR